MPIIKCLKIKQTQHKNYIYKKKQKSGALIGKEKVPIRI